MAVRNDFAAGEVLAAADLNDTFGSKLDLAGGKILQIVRATDATNRSTTSTSFVDASISVTITPQKNDSAVLLMWIANAEVAATYLRAQITDNSNNAISGAQETFVGNNAANFYTPFLMIAYATPATTSATTYKARFRTNSAGQAVALGNAGMTGQLYAIEVSA